MASPAWLTDALAVASEAVEALGLVVEVVHEAWVGQYHDGAPIFAAGVNRKARVQEGHIPHRRSADGDSITTRACVSFEETIEPHGAAGRKEPIDPNDRITLPSGYSGPIVDVRDSLVDPETRRPLRQTVWLR